MFFSFTLRAKKVLSSDFLFQISDTTPDENLKKVGIPLNEEEVKKNGSKILIKKIRDNFYRVPTKYIDPFIRCLFKYVPAYYIAPDEAGTSFQCDLRTKDDD
jgi:hypothetical protein